MSRATGKKVLVQDGIPGLSDHGRYILVNLMHKG
jgi:hypothetical protein